MELLNKCDFFIDQKIKRMSTEDFLFEECVAEFNLSQKSRNPELKDQLHFILEWWFKNKHKFKKYKSKSCVSGLINKNHATVIHYIGTINESGRRKKTWNFDENTKRINYFLNKSVVD